MKKLLLITVILLSGLTLLAQETVIEKSEFDKVMAQSYRVLMNQPHRTIEESISESAYGINKTKVINERIGTTSRTVFEADSPSSNMKTETIFVNGRRFVRKQNNPWAEEVTDNKYKPSTEWETISDEKAYKSLGESVLAGKKVKVYRTISVTIRTNKEKGGGYSVSDRTTYYFDETGLLVKSESVSEQNHKPKVEAGSAVVTKETKTITKRTKIIEIDPSIKIEAPQIS